MISLSFILYVIQLKLNLAFQNTIFNSWEEKENLRRLIIEEVQKDPNLIMRVSSYSVKLPRLTGGLQAKLHFIGHYNAVELEFHINISCALKTISFCRKEGLDIYSRQALEHYNETYNFIKRPN